MKAIRTTLQVLKALVPALIIIGFLINWVVFEKRYGVLYLFAIMGFVVLIAYVWEVVFIRINRRRGIYPQEGQATMGDVKRLISMGEKTLATHAYCEINNVLFVSGRKEVEKIIAKDKHTTEKH